MHKMGAIMHCHKIFADHMDILCSILGYRKKPLQFEGPAVTFGQMEVDTSFFEEKMVSKKLAAVFSEDDTTAQDCKPVRLVLTDRERDRRLTKSRAGVEMELQAFQYFSLEI